MKKEKKSAEDYKPLFSLDIMTCSEAAFEDVKERMEQHRLSLGPLSPLDRKDGWYTWTPQDAEQFLLRNPKEANRPAKLQTVRYYAQQFLAGDWVPTGEAITFTTDGVGTNGGNRDWASYLSGCSFPTYVIFTVPPRPDLFAFYDNVKPRTPTTALQTAGFDGVSPLINSIIHINQNVQGGAYSMQRVSRMPRLSPIEVLRLAQSDPNIKEAAHLTASEYQDAINVISHRDVTAYASYAILCKFGEAVLDEFMQDVGGPDELLSEGNPILALHRFLEANRKKIKRLPKHIVLAHVLQAFNYWKAGVQVKKVKIPVDDPFPALEGGDEPEPEFVETE